MDSRQRERLARIEKAAAGRDPDRARRLALQTLVALADMRLSVPRFSERDHELEALRDQRRLAFEADDPGLLSAPDCKQFADTVAMIRGNTRT